MPPAPPTRVALGVDIGGTNIRAARVDHDGRVEWRHALRTDSGPDPVALVIELCRAGLDDRVTAIGIGVPGRLDQRRSTVLSSGFVELAGRHLGEVVGGALGRPARLENDAAMALIAERRLGAARGSRDVVLFTAGTGIGGAVMVGGELVRGRGNAGQLGHLALERAGPVCNCGRRGCSETLASGTALGHLMETAGLAEGTSVEDLLARPGEPAAAEVLERWSGAWRAAIDTVVAVLDPKLVVIGGGLGAPVVSALEGSRAATSPWFDCPVVAAELGDDAGVIGAGLHALGD